MIKTLHIMEILSCSGGAPCACTVKEYSGKHVVLLYLDVEGSECKNPGACKRWCCNGQLGTDWEWNYPGHRSSHKLNLMSPQKQGSC